MNNKQKLWTGIITLIVVIGIGYYVFQQPAEKEADTIKIGAILPLTGELSFFGEGDRKALTLYSENNPDVEFIFEDSKGTPKDGLSAARNLVSQDIKYFISSLSYIINTIQPIFDENENLNMTLNMDPRSEEESRYCMRLYVSFYDEMDKLIELAEQNESEVVAVLYVNVETMNNAVDNYLRSELEKRNIELISETYESGANNFRNQLLKLSSEEPQIIRILDFGNKLGVILNQISEGDLFSGATIVSGLETLLADYRNFPPDVVNRFKFTAPKFLFSKDNRVIEDYINRFGEEPSFDAMFAYDIANLLIPRIKEHGYDNVDSVIQSIIQKKEFQGVAANYSINEFGGISPEIYWAGISNSEIIFDK